MYINHYWDEIINLKGDYIETLSCLTTRSSSRGRWLDRESGGAELSWTTRTGSRFPSVVTNFLTGDSASRLLHLPTILFNFRLVVSEVIQESVVADWQLRLPATSLTCTSWFHQPPAFLSTTSDACKFFDRDLLHNMQLSLRLNWSSTSGCRRWPFPTQRHDTDRRSDGVITISGPESLSPLSILSQQEVFCFNDVMLNMVGTV